MAMQQYEPIHADRHRSAFNISLILGLVLAVIGVVVQAPIWVVVGLGMAAWSWFTTPSQYVLFADRLMIAYGKPRVRHVFFEQVGEVGLISLPMGNRLRVRLTTGRMLFIQPKDGEEFGRRFQTALDSYRRDNPEYEEEQRESPEEREDLSERPPEGLEEQRERPEDQDERPPDGWENRER